MHSADRDFVPTHSMWLELAEERRFVREGHDFLDRKRVLLAGEILKRLAHYSQLRAPLSTALAAARAALRGGLVRHGIAELWAIPAPVPASKAVRATTESFLGIPLLKLEADAEPSASEQVPVNPSPEARATAQRFSTLVKLCIELAGVEESLRRLLVDYRRTQRRTRALENVIEPELTLALAAIEEHLDTQELEETVRVRTGGRNKT